MIRAIIFTFLILAVIYFFLFRSTRRRRKRDFDTVAEYRDLYIEKNSLNTYRGAFGNTKDNTGLKRSYSAYSGDSGNVNNKYVTKYNSNEDYREK